MHEFMLLYPKIPINLSYLIICHAAEPHNYRHQLCARITTVKNSQIQKKNIEKQFFNFRKYYGGIIVKYTPRLNGERGTRQKAMINCENELANYTLGQRLFFRIE